MAIDPGSPNYATTDLPRSTAVQDVDIKAVGPNGETSAKAQVVVIAGSAGGGGSGSITVDGEGTPGAPAGGIVTVQGDPIGTPIRVTPPPVTWNNRSGTITAGGVTQQLMAAAPNRRGFWVQNNSVEPLWIMDGAPATQAQPSLQLAPGGGYYESPVFGAPTAAINIIGATTGSAYSAREW